MSAASVLWLLRLLSGHQREINHQFPSSGEFNDQHHLSHSRAMLGWKDNFKFIGMQGYHDFWYAEEGVERKSELNSERNRQCCLASGTSPFQNQVEDATPYKFQWIFSALPVNYHTI